jgi:hypothetical protein
MNILVKKVENMGIVNCKICKCEMSSTRNNKFYCDKCKIILREKGAKRYRIGNLWIWVRGSQIVRATRNGKKVIPIFELFEVIE